MAALKICLLKAGPTYDVTAGMTSQISGRELLAISGDLLSLLMLNYIITTGDKNTTSMKN